MARRTSLPSAESLAAERWRTGDLSGAEQVLLRAHAEGAGTWGTWLLLGTVRSEQGDLDGAIEAYDQAGNMPDVDVSALSYNRALIAAGQERWADALDLLDQVGSDDEELDELADALGFRVRRAQRDERIEGQIWELTVEAREASGLGFFQNVHVFARDAAHAEALAREDLELPDAVCTSAEILQDLPPGPSGVFWASGRVLFPLDSGVGS
jgi:tetratricopeptide (TPR) repeat protein